MNHEPDMLFSVFCDADIGSVAHILVADARGTATA